MEGRSLNFELNDVNKDEEERPKFRSFSSD